MSKEIAISYKNGRSDKLPVCEFTFDMIVPHPIICMIAKRGSGKSWIVRALIHHFKTIPVGIIIAPTDKNSNFYGCCFPASYIHYEYKPELIGRIIERQSVIIDKQNEDKKRSKHIRDARCLIVMDDCLSQKGKWVKDPHMLELFYNGRHYHIMYILTMQFPLGITPELRSNFDYIFLMQDDYLSNMKRMYDHYAGMFPHFESFRQIYKQITSDHGAMVIINSTRGSRGDELFDKIFWYKAPNLDDVKINFGCKQFIKYHEDNYNENWRKKGSAMNIEDYLLQKRQNKSRVVIDKVKK